MAPKWERPESTHGSAVATYGIIAISATEEDSRHFQMLLRKNPQRLSEIFGYVLPLSLCPRGNYIVQEAVLSNPWSALQPLWAELRDSGFSFSKLSCNKYSCRVIERIIEVADRSVLGTIEDALLPCCGTIAQDPYGNYVLSHLVEYGSYSFCDDVKRELVLELPSTAPRGLTGILAVLANICLHFPAWKESITAVTEHVRLPRHLRYNRR